MSSIASPSGLTDTCSPTKNLKLRANRVWNILIPVVIIVTLLEFVFIVSSIVTNQTSLGTPATITGVLKVLPKAMMPIGLPSTITK